MYFLKALVVVSSVNFIYSDICADINYGCDVCLGNSFGCVWCMDEIHNDTRCRLSGNPIVNSDWCQNIVDAVTEPAKIIQNEDFRHKTKMAEAVQLKPQHVGIRSRPLSNVKFPMSYKPSLERPIDVYYLFDDSKTGKLYRRHFDTQAPKIYDALNELSGDVQFGIGTLDTMGIHDSENSDNTKKIFRNNLSLTKNISRIVGGHDNHGLMAVTLLKGLMQAIESKDINGINYGRRTIIMLFCNPRTSEPDSNTTRQNKDNYIKKINKIVENKDINVIFTGKNDFPDEYKVLVGKIRGASYIELNDVDEDYVLDLVNLIKDEYLKSVYNLELIVGVLPPHMSLKITPACERFGSRCLRKIQPGMSLNMLVTVHMIQCPRNYKYKETVTIKPIGSHDNLTIDTDVLCYCDCEEKAEANSHKCNLMGNYTCGICKCKEGRYGVHRNSCECIGDLYEDGWKKCRDGPRDYTDGCNGNGDCVCGVCRCYDGYEGHYCGKVVEN